MSRTRSRAGAALTACAAAALVYAPSVQAATPINDLGAGLYLNQYQGGLYPGGSNLMPAPHATLGASTKRAESSRPTCE